MSYNFKTKFVREFNKLYYYYYYYYLILASLWLMRWLRRVWMFSALSLSLSWLLYWLWLPFDDWCIRGFCLCRLCL